MDKIVENNLIDWLLEPDDIGVRYLALRDLADVSANEITAAQQQAHVKGQISKVLANMNKDGYWVKPGAGYSPKYTGTVWSVILLGQLGASSKVDSRVLKACSYLLDNNMTKHGQFTINGSPSGTLDCIQGNLSAALLDLDCQDSRLDKAFEWMARSVTGEGIATAADKDAVMHYYNAGKCGPNFRCAYNNKLPCAWGVIKVLLAFSKLPKEKRTPLVQRAIQTGVDFLFATDPAKAEYPGGHSEKPSENWWKLAFPVFYITDLLQLIEVMCALGYGKDPRLVNAVNTIKGKQDALGRWHLEYDYKGKTWVDFGVKKQPDKWVTLRGLRVLKSLDT